MNIMMHTEFMGFLIGSSEILLVDGLALELLSKNSIMLFFFGLFAVFSLLVNSVSLQPLYLPLLLTIGRKAKSRDRNWTQILHVITNESGCTQAVPVASAEGLGVGGHRRDWTHLQ